jgi:hypothetical protein
MATDGKIIPPPRRKYTSTKAVPWKEDSTARPKRGQKFCNFD